MAGPDITQQSGWTPDCRDSIWMIFDATGVDFLMSRDANADTSLSRLTDPCVVRYPAALDVFSDPNVSFRVNFSQMLNLGAAVPVVATRNGTTLSGTMTIPGDTLAGHWTATLCTTCPNSSIITSIVPSARTAGSAEFTLAVDGSGFTSCSTIRIDNLDRVTTFVSTTRVTAKIPSTDQTMAGTKTITVFTPSAGGGVSNGLALTIDPQP